MNNLQTQLYHSSEKLFVLKNKNEVIPIKLIESHLLDGDHLWLIDGNRCKTKNGLFKEFQTKMFFPDYFGKNWDALIECMGDLAWINRHRTMKRTMKSQSHFIIISNACKLLELNTKDRKIFIDILSFIEDCWSSELNGRKGVYRTIFSCSSHEYATVIDMLAECGVTYSDLCPCSDSLKEPENTKIESEEGDQCQC